MREGEKMNRGIHRTDFFGAFVKAVSGILFESFMFPAVACRRCFSSFLAAEDGFSLNFIELNSCK